MIEEPDRKIDIYDTGQWHLSVYFSGRRGVGWLSHLYDPLVKPRIVFDRSWNAEGKELLELIETSVYENPTLLDDYSADIVLGAPDTLWVPSVLLEDPDTLEECYTLVNRSSDADDLFVETEAAAGVCALSVFVPGLKAFLERTFPGAKITSSQMAFLRKFRTYPGGGTRIYVHLDEGAGIYTAFEGKRFLCARTSKAEAAADVVYGVMLIIKSLGLDAKTTEVYVSGAGELRREAVELLRREISYVMYTMIPSNIEGDFPLAASLSSALTIGRNRRKE